MPDEQLQLGTREVYGANHERRSVMFGINHRDRRSHTYIIGASGAGKTNLLHNSIAQDIDRGAPVIFLDPPVELELAVVHAFGVATATESSRAAGAVRHISRYASGSRTVEYRPSAQLSRMRTRPIRLMIVSRKMLTFVPS